MASLFDVLDNPPPVIAEDVRFDGVAFVKAHDQARLTGQILRIRDLMIDGAWRTLAEIESLTGDRTSSVSAQLRNLRKPRFGGYEVARRLRGNPKLGCWEYRIVTGER